jgi:predicted HTH transcriptional regulator
MATYLHTLIAQGEHQQLDFKFEISDSRKIARSLVAFANTDGGKLLVGVKDNGVVAGVRSDEEFHMVEAAAQLYCKPEVNFTTKEWNVNGKVVLEIIVPKSRDIFHKAPDKNNEYKVFVRVDDKNLLANSILLQVWKRRKLKTPVKVSFTETETTLLHHLEIHGKISRNGFMKLCNINRDKAERILVNFILLGIIEMKLDEKGSWFELSEVDYREMLGDILKKTCLRNDKENPYLK